MQELIKYGKKIVEAGLAHSHFGNVSKRIGDRILISTTGSMLDELEGQIVTVPVYSAAPDALDVIASTEVNVHPAIIWSTMQTAHGEIIVPIESEECLVLRFISVNS